LAEELAMLKILPDPARTIIATAAFVGLSKSELRGLEWPDYTGDEIRVMRGVVKLCRRQDEDEEAKGSGAGDPADAEPHGSVPRQSWEPNNRADFC
jgi:hypothetical protein